MGYLDLVPLFFAKCSVGPGLSRTPLLRRGKIAYAGVEGRLRRVNTNQDYVF